MKVTVGGNRVGSGKKMQTSINNYNRSTHNLSETYATTMGSGILYPCLCKPAMRGDSFDIDINADCRTIPTVGPLFGSYKMQVDIYQVPVRLYQGILHNNPLAIGLKANQVKLPILRVENTWEKGDFKGGMFNQSSLLAYLGMRGLGHPANLENQGTNAGRDILAIPALAYYDIFKTYYANKQEDKAYVISAIEQGEEIGIIGNTFEQFNKTIENKTFNTEIPLTLQTQQNAILKINTNKIMREYAYDKDEILLNLTLKANVSNVFIKDYTLGEILNLTYYGIDNNMWVSATIDKNTLIIQIKNLASTIVTDNTSSYKINKLNRNVDIYNNLKLVPFDLKNIDDMRYDILSHHDMGETFTIENQGDYSYLPYSVLVSQDDKSETLNKYPMNGLVLKTYQNDIYNNWLNSEWIDGENGINELTKVSVTDGAFSMDALNFAQKLYNMLNRIAVAGATYEDWQDVVYETVKRRQIESPIFCGGMSQEVMFDEIIQTSESNEENPLGTLGGRGKLVGTSKKGGKIHIKCDEACFIIGICSLTPRIYQTQGNEFYMTELHSIDDFHKPQMDGIGFQDLIGERLAAWDTVITPQSTTILHRSKVGKLPAWIEYMTSYDKAYGRFATAEGLEEGYMILNRQYEMSVDGGIKDATTYIDPAKYNYAFALQGLENQNFWVQIHFDIKARRLMSAKLIPSV